MASENVAAVAADDDFDVTADLAAAFDAAEQETTNPTPKPEPTPEGEVAPDRTRDEKGRFAKAELKEEPDAPKAAEPAKVAAPAPVAQPAAVEPIAGEVSKSTPPPGWSPAAKVAFNDLPADHPIRAAVAQREVEIDKGFAKLAEYKPIDRFMDMARQSGTTLDRALENYVSIENELRRDFPGGIAQLCQRQGIHPLQLAHAISARFGGSPSGGEAGTQPSHQTAAVDPSAIAQQIREELRAEQEAAEINRAIKQFGSDPKNTFFENVRADMGRLIESGYVETIQEAYDRACWANPEIRSLLIKQQSVASDASARAAAATQARQAAKSITGSPIPNASVKGPETSIEDELRAAFEAAAV